VLKIMALMLSVCFALLDFFAFHLVPFGFVLHGILACMVGAGLLSCALSLWRREPSDWLLAALVTGSAMIFLHAWKLVRGPLQHNCVSPESTIDALLYYLLHHR
jgi:hypothetical protein